MDDGVVQTTLNRAFLKRAAHVAGAILCLVAVILLVRRGMALGVGLGDQFARIGVHAFLGALGLYVAGGLLLGVAWALLVRWVSAKPLHVSPLFVAHLRSQIAKYLPGNVFHFAYRHIAARREGVGHRALGFALALESVLLIAAAAILGLGVAADPRLEALVPWARHLAWVAPVLAIFAWAGSSFAGRRAGLVQFPLGRTAGWFAAVLAIDFAFLLLAATALRLLCDVPTALPFGAWCGWLSLAWVVGYVTPGAPAGLGLREAVLALALAPILGDAGALALALKYRLLTLVADAVLALFGFALLRSGMGTRRER